jgi:hypothetical protein
MADSDPMAIRSIAVRADDLVTALENTLRSDGDAVVRLTPPFSGRMRARLHVTGSVPEGDPEPIHVDPTDLVENLPAYPEPSETEDELRADRDAEYTRERHRERHRRAVEAWREAVPECVVDEAVLDAGDGEHRVEVKLL